MTETPLPPAPEGPRTTADEARDLGRIRRSTTDRKVAGVAGGLGRHLDVDPLILRVAFVVLTFFGGAGLIVYAAGWLLIPEDDGSEAVVRLEDRTRGVLLAVVGVVAGVSIVAELAGNAWGPFWFPWQLVVIGIVAVVLLSRRDRTPGPSAAPAAAWTPYVGETAQGWVGQPGEEQTRVAPPPPPPAPVVRDPRRRGPLLFWFTLALVALAEGVLGTADLAGAPVADGAYPALALGIIGSMLVLGAFFGRAGGLVLVGLLTVPVLLGTTASEHIDTDPLREAPTSAASVDPAYRLGVGELLLDLTEVEDLEALDGRVLDIDVQVGRVEVLVPRGLTVQATAQVHGPGEISLFGEQRGGIDTTVMETHDGGPGSPVLVLDAETNLGEIVVSTR